MQSPVGFWPSPPCPLHQPHGRDTLTAASLKTPELPQGCSSLPLIQTQPRLLPGPSANGNGMGISAGNGNFIPSFHHGIQPGLGGRELKSPPVPPLPWQGQGHLPPTPMSNLAWSLGHLHHLHLKVDPEIQDFPFAPSAVQNSTQTLSPLTHPACADPNFQPRHRTPGVVPGAAAPLLRLSRGGIGEINGTTQWRQPGLQNTQESSKENIQIKNISIYGSIQSHSRMWCEPDGNGAAPILILAHPRIT